MSTVTRTETFTFFAGYDAPSGTYQFSDWQDYTPSGQISSNVVSITGFPSEIPLNYPNTIQAQVTYTLPIQTTKQRIFYTSTFNPNIFAKAFDHYTDSDTVYGCTNPAALNYNPLATIDDGSCVYSSSSSGSSRSSSSRSSSSRGSSLSSSSRGSSSLRSSSSTSSSRSSVIPVIGSLPQPGPNPLC